MTGSRDKEGEEEKTREGTDREKGLTAQFSFSLRAVCTLTPLVPYLISNIHHLLTLSHTHISFVLLQDLVLSSSSFLET